MNRAPYMIPLHTNWFLSEHQHEGLVKFIHWTLAKDVRYTTITDFLLWITGDLSVKPKHSERKNRQKLCNSPRTCKTIHNDTKVSELRYYRTCHTICPDIYPWI